MEVYVWFNGGDPEDTIIFLSKEEAIETSIKYPNIMIEIFTRAKLGYQMSDTYYRNGVYHSSK